MKKIYLTVVTALFSALFVGAALAEPPEYKELRNGNGADRWEEKQYRRADEFDRRGEHQKAQEVREYGHERANKNREAADTVKDNWPGDR